MELAPIRLSIREVVVSRGVEALAAGTYRAAPILSEPPETIWLLCPAATSAAG